MKLEKPKNTIPKAKKGKQLNKFLWEKYQYWNQKEMPLASLEDLAYNLVKMAYEDKSIITLNKLYLLNYVDYYSMVGYMKKCEKLKNAVRHVKLVIGNRREELALRKKLEPSTFKMTQGSYDPIWQSQEQYFANLKADQKQNQSSGTFYINMPGYKELEKEVLNEAGNKSKAE